jgi:hypothetical protein
MIAMELTWGLRIIGFSVIFRAGQKDVRSFERVTMRTLRRHSRHRGEGPLGLRFVAAVSASCSGDKSDKEESAGCFGAMGIVGCG